MTTDSRFCCLFDHLVVAASELDEGVSWFENLSGVRLPSGGSHPLMGTHNHLSALSDNAFLEIIATDPAAQQPSRSRWFDLDNEALQKRLRLCPSLLSWVVSTNNLAAALDAVREVGIDAGELVTLTRDDLQWQIGIRPDGTLACDGVFPILIQWPENVNPVSRMKDQELRLHNLHLQHPQIDLIEAALHVLGAQQLVSLQAGAPMLRAQLAACDHTFDLQT